MINKCRLCESKDLEVVLDLGVQALSGHFPTKEERTEVIVAPLVLMRCLGECGLVQLSETIPPDILYDQSYGYASGINESMVEHLYYISCLHQRYVKLEPHDMVIDIGCNDGTLLNQYNKLPQVLYLMGIDPIGGKFQSEYFHFNLIAKTFESIDPIFRQAKIIHSIAMFYDVSDPLTFAIKVRETLHPEGIWITEQSYLPSMLANNSYDTICHEHLAYYDLPQMHYIANKAGLKIIDFETNSVNGGSFIIIFAHKENDKLREFPITSQLIPQNEFEYFRGRVSAQQTILKSWLTHCSGTIYGYGASTKGNVILQTVGATEGQIKAIADRNPEKWGKYTPGTNFPKGFIPIISEEVMREGHPDYLLCLPWHFKKSFIQREKEYLLKGGKLVFPLPEFEIIGKEVL